ncbi:MAG: glutamate 5-kinase [Candidatus Gastranaerophilales bacterium]|nr:glutamate 5-kinase [Candidatus Gastranaerophilales bacterium]
MDIKEKIKEAKRIVFKFGTNALSRQDGSIALSRIYGFIEDIADLKNQDKEILIVTSGAVGLGAARLGIKKPSLIAAKQACAAVGQAKLMHFYEDAFEKFGVTVAQVLLTEDDFNFRSRYLSLKSALNELLSCSVIPIINQNDTVSAAELKPTCHKKACFGDNDKLSSLVMSGLDADLLVILSDVDGLYNDDPRVNKDAKLISVVEDITPDIEKLGFDASKGGRGGMKTKLEAAKVATHSGGIAVIANGNEARIIRKIFSDEPVGTVFLPSENLSEKRRWIAYATNLAGAVKVNSGAYSALLEKNASLLPIGIVDIINSFDKNDVVSILNEAGEEVARGMVNYSSKDCKKLLGKHSDDIEKILGYRNYDAIITRDNIIFT